MIKLILKKSTTVKEKIERLLKGEEIEVTLPEIKETKIENIFFEKIKITITDKENSYKLIIKRNKNVKFLIIIMIILI